ncbi:hypothetical protein KAI87_00705 [Myxococcota bacterium]|nr:hypothetical protein [Myxococcota bacterium]
MRFGFTSLAVVTALFSLISTTTVVTTANAQSLEEALSMYKSKDFHDAAFAFYDVLQNDANPDHRDQAEIYLAEALRKTGFWVPALFYYTDLFKAGPSNRYYLNAVEGLLETQKVLHDSIIIPSLINELLDPEQFARLNPDQIAHINYMVGELSFRQRKNQDARAFLEYVPEKSPMHPKARYLLGLIEIRDNASEKALSHFKAIFNQIIPEDTDDEELARVRSLAQIAAGRTAYGLGRFEEATEHFRSVPRFSEMWFTSLYENAWSHFQRKEYGHALGELQSVTSPYFSKRHVPEAYVISGTAFFINCQWDRVRRSVGYFKRTYDPMLTQLQTYISDVSDPVEYYRDIVAGGNGRISLELAREVRRSKRFRDYHYMITHMDWELNELNNIPVWKGSRLGEDISLVVEQQREQLEPAVGAWARTQLRNRAALLQHFQNQINILDFEVADAERKWLEQGKEILKGRRARLPRPEIPNDQWQHWNFDREYWVGELGYIQHTIRSECF